MGYKTIEQWMDDIKRWESERRVEEEFKIREIMKAHKLSFEDAKNHLADLEAIKRYEEEREWEEQGEVEYELRNRNWTHPERDSLWDITGGVR